MTQVAARYRKAVISHDVDLTTHSSAYSEYSSRRSAGQPPSDAPEMVAFKTVGQLKSSP